MKRTIALLVIALHAPLCAAVYRCVDEKGNTIFGDTPPTACAGNAPIYELSKAGRVLRKIDAPLTPEQLRERAAEEERRKAEKEAIADQKRKDVALLSSYGNPREFDVARDRNIEPVTGRIAAAEQRIKELDKREKELKEQMEFYKGGKSKRTKEASPADDQTGSWFRAEIDRVHKDRTVLADSIARYKKEIVELNAKYDADKKRWIALKEGGGTIRAEAHPETVSAPAKGKGR
jgi:chromosome segregation ATPase